MSDMIVIRHAYVGNYTVLDNAVLDDERLSFKATGLWAYLMHLPPGWKLYLSHLKTIKADGLCSLRSGVSELERLGYISIDRVRNADGTFGGSIWTVKGKPPPRAGDAK